jgi:hypothetical protein
MKLASPDIDYAIQYPSEKMLALQEGPCSLDSEKIAREGA